MIPVPWAIIQSLRHAALAASSALDIKRPLIDNEHGEDGVEPEILRRIRALLGKSADRDVTSPTPVPARPTSILDGYALSALSAGSGAGGEFFSRRVVRRAYAGGDGGGDGHAAAAELDAVYIATGAALPEGLELVAPVEECAVTSQDGDSGDVVRVPASSALRKNVREIGSDVAVGEVLIGRGAAVGPAEVGLMASCGITWEEARRILRGVDLTAGGCGAVSRPPVAVISVGVLSTGDELVEGPLLGAPAPAASPRRIYDANRPSILSLLASLGSRVAPIDLGIVPDDPGQIAAVLRPALESCDLVVTTGGVSAGEKDLVIDVLIGLGCDVVFRKMMMKPGKPTALLRRRPGCDGGLAPPALALCLPGNPVSSLVCAQLLCVPMLDVMRQVIDERAAVASEAEATEYVARRAAVHRETSAGIDRDVRLDAGRPEYHRVALAPGEVDGAAPPPAAASTGFQRSSRLLSCAGASGLAVLPRATPGAPILAAGTPALVLRTGADACSLPVAESVHVSGYLWTRRGDGVSDERENVLRTGGPAGRGGAGVLGLRLGRRTRGELRETVARLLPASLGPPRQVIVRAASAGEGNGRAVGDAVEAVSHDLRDRDVVFVVLGRGSDGNVVRQSLDVADALRCLAGGNVEADGMALEALRGAAAQDGRCAVFEIAAVTVGKGNSDGKKMLVILLPEDGLEGALSSIAGTLGRVARLLRGER
mmetsp:Transcript_42190/g.82781  ORF Transcript_42190/g.82781 Transcript_42190/m.82781 type:complete len:713 (+) Transcript_42190:54-2192(+)